MLASDGDIEEGVTSEASSLAGTQHLGNLTVIYDHNHISIEDDTNIALSEDTAARYEAYGWHVQSIDWTNDDTQYEENVPALIDALEEARKVTDRPSFISLRTIIGWPAPDKRNTGKAHGSALGADEVAATKKILGFDPDQTFEVDDDVIAHTRKLLERGRQAQDGVAGRVRHLGERQRRRQGPLRPDGRQRADPGLGRGPAHLGRGPEGHRHPGRVGQGAQRPGRRSCPSCGAARPTWPSPTTPRWRASRASCPLDRQSKMFPGNPYGRTLHFGIREHAMGSIMNGIKVHGGTRPYGGTFLTFSDYMRPPVRLAALMRIPVTFVWTHDSIGLGEDGPTHQPIEHLSALRTIPGLRRRPADGRQRDHGLLGADPEEQGPPGGSDPEPAEPARSCRAEPTASPTPATSARARTSSRTARAPRT